MDSELMHQLSDTIVSDRLGLEPKRPEGRQQGGTREIPLRPGLSLILTKATYAEDVASHFEMERSPLLFCFVLSGGGRSTVNLGKPKPTIIEAKAGTCTVSYFPKAQGYSQFPPGKPVHMLHIQADPIVLGMSAWGDLEFAPADLRAVMGGCPETHYHYAGSMRPSMQTALHQLLNCPYQGLIKRVFLESKALELISLQLEQAAIARNSIKKTAQLRPSDIDRVHKAMNIIVENMQAPPSLLELASRVGLNDFKLKHGFRQVCGQTAFGYLHEHRMERARQLLEEGQMNIKEISYQVGYMDAGRFSDAFKTKFGIRPSLYRTQSSHTEN